MCKLKDTEAFAAYEKAIEGYQFQVGRYNTWMNYYALFVGALFVALYSVWPKSEANAINKINNVIIGGGHYTMNEVVKAPGQATWDNAGFLPGLISIIGWIASMCWYGALLGYRKWNDHWMSVIHKVEDIFAYKEEPSNPTCDSYPPVYQNLPKPKKPGHRFVAGYISTQKMTGIFIFFVAWAWATIFCYIMWENGFKEYWVWIFLAAGGGITFLFIKILFHWTHWRIFCSSIPELKKTQSK